MSHKLSELGIQHDGFICFNNPDEVVSDKEVEEIKNDLANMRKEALKMLAEKKNDKSGGYRRMKIDGNKIKKIRLSLGKSQEEFGKLFDPPAPKSAVSRWEKGHGARKERLKKIAKLARVPVESLYPDLLAEEQRNCPYCHVGSDRSNYPLFDGYSINDVTGKKTEITVLKDPELPIFVPCLEDTNYETEYDNSTPVMNYCPMCGRPLSSKAEPSTKRRELKIMEVSEDED